jgi:hypothetical protein
MCTLHWTSFVLWVSHALANLFFRAANQSLTMATTELITPTLRQSLACLLLEQSCWTIFFQPVPVLEQCDNPPRSAVLSFRWRGRATHELTRGDQASFIWGSEFTGYVCCADLGRNYFEHQEIRNLLVLKIISAQNSRRIVFINA